ncbi:MAG: MFS transporter [Alphaproteobacteria bacterium]
MIRVSPTVMAQDLMADLNIQACSLGTLTSFYYIGYTCMQIPVGLMLDRIGVRRPLTFACLLCLGGCMMFSMSSDIFIMSIGRFMMGVGSAFGFLSCVKTASLWFHPTRLGVIIGLSMTIGTTGATFGYYPLASLVDQVTWRPSVMILASFGLILGLAAWLVIRDRYTNIYSSNAGEDHETFPILKSIWVILKNPYTYVFGLYGSLMYVPLSGFADLWGSTYLMNSYGLSRTEASGLVSTIYIGVAIGAPLSALLSDIYLSHKKVLLIGALGSLLCFSTIIYAPIPQAYTYPLYIIGGIFSGSQFLAFASVVNYNLPQISGAASGIHNMMCMMSGIIFQPFIGYLLDLCWDGSMHNGVSVFAQNDFLYALSVIPIGLVLSALACLFMKETYLPDQPKGH